MENKTEAYMNWETFYFGFDTEVTTRLDKGKAETREWSESTDSRAAFHPNPIAFIRRLALADTLIVRAAPVNEPLHEVRFDLRGLRFHLPDLQAACNWD